MEIFQDKDAKISFLQKAIDVVVLVSGEPLLAKPARIVAGHEPERTNELLQRIGKCCLSKVVLRPCSLRFSRAERRAVGEQPERSGTGLRREFLAACVERCALNLIPPVLEPRSYRRSNVKLCVKRIRAC